MNKNSILNILYQKMQNIHRCAVFNVYNDNKIKYNHCVNHRIVVNASDFRSNVQSSNLPRDLNSYMYFLMFMYIADITTILIILNNTNWWEQSYSSDRSEVNRRDQITLIAAIYCGKIARIWLFSSIGVVWNY